MKAVITKNKIAMKKQIVIVIEQNEKQVAGKISVFENDKEVSGRFANVTSVKIISDAALNSFRETFETFFKNL